MIESKRQEDFVLSFYYSNFCFCIWVQWMFMYKFKTIKIITSNLCRIFRLRWVYKMFGGSDSSTVERNFTIGQSYKIWGNFTKICIKINKNLKKHWENSRENGRFSGYLSIFLGDINFLIMGKIKYIICPWYNGVFGEACPRAPANL